MDSIQEAQGTGHLPSPQEAYSRRAALGGANTFTEIETRHITGVWGKRSPADLSPENTAQLQVWLPSGGSPSPGEWEELYRAIMTHGSHGLGAAELTV